MSMAEWKLLMDNVLVEIIMNGIIDVYHVMVLGNLSQDRTKHPYVS